MANSYSFCVVQFPASPLRGERLNLGLAIFRQDRLDVRSTRRLEKLKSISAAVDLTQVSASLNSLSNLDKYSLKDDLLLPEHRLSELSSISPFEFSAMGYFISHDEDSYERQIRLLMATLVDPEPAPALEIRKKPSRLLTEVKVAFREEGVLAKKGETIESHRLIANYQVAEGLNADLLLKNGAMHILEAVDASALDVSFKKVVSGIAVSALVFEQARMVFGASGTTSRLIYTASSALEAVMTPSLYAAEHQGARLINWESEDDRRSLITQLAGLATPLPRPKKRRSDARVDASAQHRFKLN